MKSAIEADRKFPFDCFTESNKCDEPWALIAKRGVFRGGKRDYAVEKYHKLSFPVITQSDQIQFQRVIVEMGDDIARTFTVRVDSLKELFEQSNAAEAATEINKAVKLDILPEDG